MPLKRLILTLALLMSPLAHAGGSAMLAAADGSRIRLEFSGAQLRMEAGSGDPGAVIFRDGQAYAVMQSEGETLVMEMGAMLRMAATLAPPVPDAFDDVAEFGELAATGRKETHAGLTGEVHRLNYRDRKGKTHSMELVLTADARAEAFTRALMQMSTQLAALAGTTSAPRGSAALETQLRSRKLGLLRAGNELRVIELSNKTPSAGRFELPAAPMQMPDLSSLPANLGMEKELDQALGKIFGGE